MKPRLSVPPIPRRQQKPPSRRRAESVVPEAPKGAAAGPVSPPAPPVSRLAAAPAAVASITVTAETAGKVLDLITAGSTAARRGEIDKAMKGYAEALSLDPTNIRAFLCGANLRCDNRVRDWPGAIADATEVIGRDPKTCMRSRLGPSPFTARTVSASSMTPPRLSISTPIASMPTRSVACVQRAGESKHAIVDLSEFIARVPTLAWPFMNRASAYLRSATKSEPWPTLIGPSNSILT